MTSLIMIAGVALLAATLHSTTVGVFAFSVAPTITTSMKHRLYSTASKTEAVVDEMGCTTTSFDKYDVVTVDLEDNRDYPIYIGTDYTDNEGKVSMNRWYAV